MPRPIVYLVASLLIHAAAIAVMATAARHGKRAAAVGASPASTSLPVTLVTSPQTQRSAKGSPGIAPPIPPQSKTAPENAAQPDVRSSGLHAAATKSSASPDNGVGDKATWQQPAPEYPQEAREKGLEGTVVISIVTDESGAVKEATLVTSSGHTVLDVAALSAVKQWKLSPSQTVEAPIVFRFQ
jgi:protein TonB